MVDHLEKILRLDALTTSVPMHGTALVAMVGYEILARCTDPPPGVERTAHWRFAQQHEVLYGLGLSLGSRVFRALRNGLAHAYGQYPIPVDGFGDVRLILTWKDGAHIHFRPVTMTPVEGHAHLAPAPVTPSRGPALVCVNVDSLCADLRALIGEIEGALAADAAAARRFQELLAQNRKTYSDNLKGAMPPRGAPSSRRGRLRCDSG